MINYMFKYGTVVSVDDENDGDRIRVFVKGEDSPNFKISDIPYAFPFLPKNLYIKPKVGEMVFCFSQNGDFENDRFYIGPIISQPHKLDGDTITPLAFLQAGLIKPDVAPSTNPNNVGVRPDNNDIALQGRGNSDILIKPNEIRIRAGKSLDLRELNRENPSYIQTKYDRTDNSSSVNIVADNINILSHKSIDKFNLTDPYDLINDDEYKNIIEKAHQLPFGDVLIDFIKIFMKAFSTHVHAYAGLPPDLTQIELKNLLSYDIEKILSKNIRIN